MAALATTSNLSNYHRLSISSYRDQLRRSGTASSIDVAYSYRGKAYRYSIQLTTTAPHYGGSRYWFNCPLCSKKTSVLYCAGSYICRQCIGACYVSQLQQPIDSIYNRLNIIRVRLGWQTGVINGIGLRPKGMHHSTFDLLVNQYQQMTAKLLELMI